MTFLSGLLLDDGGQSCIIVDTGNVSAKRNRKKDENKSRKITGNFFCCCFHFIFSRIGEIKVAVETFIIWLKLRLLTIVPLRETDICTLPLNWITRYIQYLAF